MNRNNLLLRLFGILTYCLAGTVAREALVGGHIGVYPDFQFQVVILIDDQASRCSGGILTDDIILTAAHCVINEYGRLKGRNISVLAKTCDLSVTGIVARVRRVFVPMEYVSSTPNFQADIAILKLRSSLEVEENALKTLFLPKNKHMRYSDKTARIGGFGWNKVFENNVLIGENTDHRIRYSNAVVRSPEECRLDHPQFQFSRGQFCARLKQDNPSRPRGVCIGDGGGPLVLKGKTVIGVLSITPIGCSERNTSGIYTQVAYYLDFIKYVIQDRVNSEIREYIVV